MASKGAALARFIEGLAVQFDAAGLPPMAGRVLGHLLVSDPPEQSSADLQAALEASSGSISMTTSLLTRMQLVERVRRPGDRKHYFVIRPGVWSQLMADQVEQVRAIRRRVDEGLEILADAPPEQRARLEEMRAFYAFYEKEMPALVERWQATRNKLVA